MSEGSGLPFETITIGTVFSGGGFLMLLGLLIRQVGPWRKQTTDATDKIIEQLTAQLTAAISRIDRLEQAREADRDAHYIELKRTEARHAAYRSLDRHKFNNSEGSFDSLLQLLEFAENLPAKLVGAIAKVREKRFADREAEKQEAATIHAAEIKAVAIAEAELRRQKTGEVVEEPAA